MTGMFITMFAAFTHCFRVATTLAEDSVISRYGYATLSHTLHEPIRLSVRLELGASLRGSSKSELGSEDVEIVDLIIGLHRGISASSTP